MSILAMKGLSLGERGLKEVQRCDRRGFPIVSSLLWGDGGMPQMTSGA